MGIDLDGEAMDVQTANVLRWRRCHAVTEVDKCT